MRNLLLAAAAASMVAAPALADPHHGRHHGEYRSYSTPVVVYRSAPTYRYVQRSYTQPYYGYNQYPYYGNYQNPYSYRYGQSYRGSARYWRGYDGRYYCRRDNGTVGVLVGAGLGAILGRSVDTHGERATGTILGGAIGALLGSEVSRGNVRCR